MKYSSKLKRTVLALLFSISMLTVFVTAIYAEQPTEWQSFTIDWRNSEIYVNAVKKTYGGALRLELPTRAVMASLDVAISGSYRYCGSENNPNSCTLNTISQCKGTFCPPGVSPGGSTIYPLPAAKSCSFSYVQTLQAVPPILDRNVYYASKFSPIESLNCGPCTQARGNGRCADLNVVASVQKKPGVSDTLLKFWFTRQSRSFSGVQ